MKTSGNPPIGELPRENSDPIAQGIRRRQYYQSSSYSTISISAVAALTVAVSYLCVSPAAGFLSSTPRSSVEGGGTNTYPRGSQPISLHASPFGIHLWNKRQLGAATRLYMAPGGASDDKEEWSAILASFQLYKAAYGDLKIPTRFVVPSMKPWPGKFL